MPSTVKDFRFYTTINLAYQKWAEDAVRRQLHILDKRQGWRDDKENLLENEVENLEELTEHFWDESRQKTWLDSWRSPTFGEDDIMEAVVLDVARAKASVKIKEYTGEITNKEIAWTKSNDLTKLIERGDVIHVKIASLDEEELPFKAALDQAPALDGAVLAIEPQTGEIKAMVGGYSFRHSKWNNATQAMRQAGSVIKAHAVYRSYR